MTQSWNDGLTDLQSIMSELYQDDDRIRSVAAQAGIPTSRIDIGGAPASDWYNVLLEAANLGRVDNLVQVAVADFPPQKEALELAIKKYQDKFDTDAVLESVLLPRFDRWVTENLRQIGLALLTSLIATWLLQQIPSQTWLRQVIVVPQVFLILVVPFVLGISLRKMGITLDRLSHALVTVFVIFATTALFSEANNWSQVKLPDVAAIQGEISNFTLDDPNGYSEIKARTVQLAVKQSTQALDELHILLEDVSWSQWEKWPGMERRYGGSLHFIVTYRCDSPSAKIRPVLHSYAMRPVSIVLSWITGFVEIPYMVTNNKHVVESLTDLVEDGTLIQLCGSASTG